jgi:hypothetical protein
MSEQPYGHAGRVQEPAGENWNVGRPQGAQGPTSMWAGWIAFAGVLMVMIGAFGAIEGLVALLNDDFYVAGPNNVFVFDLTGWGWLHLIGGALIAITGIALLADQGWARPVTVVLAVLNAIVQLTFIGVYPFWSIIVIALCVMVIWAIVVHGNESRLDW